MALGAAWASGGPTGAACSELGVWFLDVSRVVDPLVGVGDAEGV